MSRVLLVGATGFVGRHVRARAAAAGVDVVPAARTPELGGLTLDLAERAGPVADALRDVAPDAVVNCAGATRGDPADLVRGNVVAVANLLAALTASGVEARLVHLGSAAEYGDVPRGTPVSEATPPRPVSAYGVTKLAGTELVRAAAGDGLDAVVLRVFNPIGPGSPESTLAGRLAAELRRTAGRDDADDIRVGSLAASRDLVDVRDVADAVLAAVRADGPLPPVLNVGSGRATPLRDLAAGLVRVTGSARRVLEAAAGSERSSGVGWQQADVRAAGRALGWKPATDLTTSLRDLWAETAWPGR
ncbi:NAD-dependent epimerase/dehydratase family protein [Actinomadura chibensis]|uniref:NAD(P)-dependent oxidoreductase n=1 Tax=Actinomadura chibensis TaxID=392828 RepID=A0A5D0NLJ5_9ACTN|nr:NAD-dependent epimerase/dehydratase family protein [Actinomadura chibensis]TYB45356.1 NAD(P)-dependent oxidoreductase [Actinomadura chibensis]